MVFVDWNPVQHPRDNDGKFIKKGHGKFVALFNIGKKLASKAQAASKLQAETSPTATNKGVVQHDGTSQSVKIGGVLVKGPDSKQPGFSVDYALQQGEWVSKLYGVTDGLVQFHPDGSVTVLHPTDALEVPTHETFDSLKDMADSYAKIYGPYGEWKISNPIDSFDLAGKPVKHFEALNDLPVGAQIDVANAGKTVMFQKHMTDKWFSSSSAFSHTSEQFKPAIAAGKVTYRDFDSGAYAKDQTFDLEELLVPDSAPGKPVISGPDTALGKIADAITPEKPVEPAKADIPGLKPGQKIYVSKGNKSLFAIVEDGKVKQLLHKNTGNDTDITKQQVYNWQFALKKGTLVETNDLTGINLHTTEKAAPESSAQPDMTPEAPTPKAPKKFMATSKPGEGIAVPGTDLTLQPGQQLYASKGNKKLYAVVEGGKVKSLVDKESGSSEGITKQQVYNWQFALKKGTLIPVFDAGKPTVAEEADTFLEKSAEAVSDGKAEIGVPETSVEDTTNVPDAAVESATPEVTSDVPTPPVPDAGGDSGSSLTSDEEATLKKLADAPPKKSVAKKSKKKDPNVWAIGLSSSPETYKGVVTLKENQSVWQGDGIQFGLISGKIPQIWDESGAMQAQWKHPELKGKKSAATLLKKGYVPIGSGPIPEPVEDLALPDPDNEISLADFKELSIGEKNWGYYNESGLTKDVYNLIVSGNNGEVDPYSAELLATDNFRNTIKQALATIIAGRKKYNDDLTQTEKSRITKSVNVWTAAAQLADLVARVSEGDPLTSSDEAHFDSWAEILNDNSKVHGVNFGMPINKARHLFKQVKFAQGLDNLDFNPMSGTEKDYQGYLKSKGILDTSGYTLDMLKAWTLADLGAPDTNGSGAKDSIAALASKRQKLAALATHADAVLAKKKALGKGNVQMQQVTAKKAESVLNKLQAMHSTYTTDDGKSMTYVGGDTWNYQPHSNATGTILSMEAVQAAISNDKNGWKANGHKLSDPVGDTASKLDLQFGGDWVDKYAFSAFPSSYEAQGMTYATIADSVDWLTAYLIGDVIGQYEVERRQFPKIQGHPLEGVHPGAPESVTGMERRQQLSNWLATQGWWKGADLADYTTTDVDQAAKALGLDAAAKSIKEAGGPSQTNPATLKRWLINHANLPAPQTTQVSNDTVQYKHGGFTLDVAPGDYVMHSAGMGAVAHIHDGKIAYVFDTDTTPPKYEGNIDDAMQMAANLTGLGYQDVTPAFTASSVLTDMPKPANVSDLAWKAVIGSEDSGEELKNLIGDIATADDFTVQALLSDISPHSSEAAMSADTKAKLFHAPDAVQRLAAWAYSAQFNGPQDQRNLATEVLKAVILRTEAGLYVPAEPPTTYKAPHGITISIPPGAKLYALADNNYMVYFSNADESSAFGYVIKPNGSIGSTISNYTAKNYKDSGKQVAESLANLNPAKAKLEGYSFSDGAWDALGTAEGQKKWSLDQAEAASAYLTKQALQKHSWTDTYPNLPLKMALLPVGVKQFALQAALSGDKDKLDALTWKMGKGFYDTGVYQHSHLIVDPDAPYAEHVGKGLLSAEQVAQWPHDAQMAFVSDHADGIKEFFPHHPTLQTLSVAMPSDLGVTISQYMDHLTAKKEALTNPPKMGEALKDTSNITLTYVKPKPDGMHTGAIYADQFGEEWMTKSFPSDPNAKARVDAEHYANVIGRLFGFNQPTTFVRTMPDGQYSYVQHWAPADGTLAGYAPKDLTEDQLSGTMQEHVLDWLLSNHDSHSKNLLRAPDGKAILGIDKGQAFVNYHRDKLAVGYLPPTNPVPVWYDDFYNAVINHKIDQELATRVTTRVLLKAYQTQSRNDTRFRELLDAALEKRTNFPDKYPNKDALVEAIMARKAALLDDFAKLYEGIWKKAGWDWNIDPKSFTSKVGLAHVQNGALFTETVKQSGSVGTALMFSSPDVSEGHGMFTVMDQKDGGSTLLGSLKVTKDADAKLVTWLSGKVDPDTLKNIGKVKAVEPPSSQLLGVPELYNAIVSYAKTLSTHFNDGEYNMTTVEGARNQAEKMQGWLDSVLKHRKSDPTLPYKGKGVQFLSLEQQDAWVAATQKHLSQFAMAEEALKQKKKIGDLYPNEVPFDAISYQPSPGLADLGSATISERWKLPDGDVIVKTKDGGHWQETAGGKKEWLSGSDFKAFIDSGDAEKLSVRGGEAGATWTASNGAKYALQEDGTWWEYSPAGSVVAKGLDDSGVEMAIAMSPDEWKLHGPEGEEKTVEVQIVGKQLKVTYAKAGTHTGSVDFKTGKLLETKTGDETEFQTGTDYVVEHGNVRIRYRPHTGNGVANSQKGLLQLQLKNWDGTPTSLDDALDTLQIMGLDVDPADQESLELLYWRQLTDVLRNRKEGNQSGQYKDVLNAISTGLNDSNMSASDEIAVYKKAWSKVVKNVDQVDYTPQFDTWFGQRQGHPWWKRPDMDEDALKTAYKSTVPIHAVQGNGKVARAVKVIQSGGLFSSEERVRVLGKLYEGMSSFSDQSGSGNGSSVYVFTRQNANPFGYSSDGYSFLLDPRAALKSTNFSYGSDSFGNMNSVSGTPFSKDMYSYSGSSNELMIKDGVPVMYVMASSSSDRQALLSALEKEGITEVRGIPVEEFVLGPGDWKSKMAQVWTDIAAEEKQEVELAA